MVDATNFPQCAPGGHILRLAFHALDMSSDRIFWADAHGRIIYANKALCTSLEFSSDELLSLHASDLLPDLTPQLWPMQWKELKTSGALAFQTRQTSKSAKMLMTEFSITLVTVDDTEYACAVACETQRPSSTKPGQSALSNTARGEQLQIIFDTMQAGIVLVNRQGVILFANQRMADMFGCTLEELIGTPYPEHVHPDQQQSGDEQMRRLIRGEIDHVHHERRYIRSDGSDFWGHLSGRRHDDAEGNLISLIGVIADITDIKLAEEHLRQRKKLFTSLADNLPDIVARMDRNHRHIYVNKQVESTTGIPASQFIGKTNQDLGMSPELLELWKETVDRVFETGEIAEITFTFDSETEQKHFGSRIVPERGESGTIDTVLSIARDITESVKAERTIRESEQNYRAMIDNMQDVFYRSDAEGRLTMVSPSGAELLGYDRIDQMLGKVIHDTFYHDVTERDSFLHNLKLKGHVSGYEVTLRQKDGTPVPVATSSHLLYGEDGTYAGVEGVFHDMRAHHETMALLTASEEKFSTIFRTSPDAIFITKLDNAILLDANEGFTAMLGYSSEEVVGRPATRLGIWLDPEDRVRFIRQLMEQGHIKNFEARLRHKDGTSIIALASSSLITIDGTSCTLNILRDISEREAMQHERIKIQKLESLGVLAGGIAHDFNNLLTGIIGNISYAALLVGHEHKAAARLKESQNAAQRAAELTQQLLTFARGGEPVKKTVNATHLIEESLSFTLCGSNVKSKVSLAADLWLIHADAGQVNQVLNNLLINARQAMETGGTVHLKAVNRVIKKGAPLLLKPGRYVCITIEDEGCGIPADQLSRIFDPYFTTKKLGTGLGMTSVYSIIRRHNGLVDVTSVEGHGTTVTLYLPAVAVNSAQQAEREQEDMLENMSGKILVMDDEEMIRDLAVVILEETGYSVASCDDGAHAVELVTRAHEAGAPFDAVILDLTVPGGMGGKEAASQIRELDQNVVLMVSSGYSNDPVVANYSSHGFSGAVSKPYNMNNMTAELARLLAARVQ